MKIHHQHLYHPCELSLCYMPRRRGSPSSVGQVEASSRETPVEETTERAESVVEAVEGQRGELAELVSATAAQPVVPLGGGASIE